MKLKSKFLSRLAVALPVAAVSAASFSNAASAASIFANGDKTSIFTTGQIIDISLETIFPSVVFTPPTIPPVPGRADIGVAGSPLATASTSPDGLGLCADGNLLSLTCDGDIVNPFDTTPGPVIADFLNVFDTTGGTDGDDLSIQFSLDPNTIANPSSPTDSVLQIVDPDPNTAINECDPGDGGTLAVGCELAVDFFASGKATNLLDTSDVAHVTYAYSGTRFTIESGSGTDADPFVTDFISNAGNLEIAVKAPEPGAVSGLLVLGAIGSLGLLRRKVRK